MSWALQLEGCFLSPPGESVTCSKGLFVLMPFPPTKIQLSLKPRLLMLVLPSSEIRAFASSFNLVRGTSHLRKSKYLFF